MARQKEMKNIPFYERPSADLLCKAAGLLAGAFMLAAPFLRWRSVHVKADVRVSEGFSMFDVVKRVFSSDFAGENGQRMKISLLLLLMAVSAVWVLFFAFRDQICPEKLRKVDSFGERVFGRFRLISHLMPIVLGILAVVLLERTLAYSFLRERLEMTYIGWQGLMIKGYHDWKLPGLGCWFFYLGITLYLFAEGFRYLIETLNEDD